MERGKPDIRLPATFVCSMTSAEALSRIAAAKHHPGVAFFLEGKTADNRVVGHTVVINLQSFDKFNQEVFPEPTENLSRGQRKFSP